MTLITPLPFVADMTRAKDCGADAMGLEIVEDHGALALDDIAALSDGVFGDTARPTAPTGRRNLLLCFETADRHSAVLRMAPRLGPIRGIED